VRLVSDRPADRILGDIDGDLWRGMWLRIGNPVIFVMCQAQFAVWCGWIGGIWWLLVAICGLVWLDRRYLMAAGRNLRSGVAGSAVFGGYWSQFAVWCGWIGGI